MLLLKTCQFQVPESLIHQTLHPDISASAALSASFSLPLFAVIPSAMSEQAMIARRPLFSRDHVLVVWRVLFSLSNETEESVSERCARLLTSS